MMQQANYEFGFEADNIPLMIEAIPVSADSIILIITKVEDPEELDTRFSKFTPFGGPAGDNAQPPLEFEGADDIIDVFQDVYKRQEFYFVQGVPHKGRQIPFQELLIGQIHTHVEIRLL